MDLVLTYEGRISELGGRATTMVRRKASASGYLDLYHTAQGMYYDIIGRSNDPPASTRPALIILNLGRRSVGHLGSSMTPTLYILKIRRAVRS